ncbi:conserved hypothetical protein [Talaromyces stipitatus ATCC 10500]|uniref:Basic proline-rich protein n=1 Tax=Talaromyces stipitatus (strain ATCC 10500 / CBS 375.48 / QM 6759 / NRRL 1006) TaxID=441959 RepID=B8LZK9_TALSN|nr:uncharacterized protein TSTA_096810 [Talaromyces stipitatus ATCC 10500]EED22432.1 conserved hypothetical protein [Talaromyces stipitatus ATCC 10500]
MTESFVTPEQIRLPPSPTRSPLPYPNEDLLSVPSLFTTSMPPIRNRSPLSRTHARSRSLASPFPTQMTRAHSSPGLDSRGRYVYPPSIARPPSPMEHSIRRQSPLRVADDMRTLNLSSLNISETISEHAELELPSPSPSTESQPTYSQFSPSYQNTNPRPSRRSSSSSLHSNLSSITINTTSSPGSVHSSPVMVATKFNESYPGLSFSSASSMPSTPTSLRSRSPSISSLETIPDIPDAEADAEAEAIEMEETARLKSAADATDADCLRRRSTLENSMSGNARGYGARNDKRKRWSVCGAERRQDLDLETIWED